MCLESQRSNRHTTLMNRSGPKVRLSRRLGVPLTPKAARIMQRRSSPPGQHGSNPHATRKLSDYKMQLLEKQKLRAQYNIHERQMAVAYAKAIRMKGASDENLIQVLETRLDALVLRAGFASTIYAARQLVTHGHFLVNGHPVNVPAYRLRVGDVVQVKPRSRTLALFGTRLDAIPPCQVPYIEASREHLSFRLVRLPKRAEVPVICDVPRVIEYYSR
jgi:small subunit ribosomal protein S4